MEVIRGSAEHASDVAEFWNAKAQDKDSWWYAAPAKTAAEITDLLSQGYSLVVAIDGKQLIGFGMWFGPQLIGFTATSARSLLSHDAGLGRGELWPSWPVGNSRSATTEKAWTDALNVAEIKPLGHKPLKPGDDEEKRKPWTCRADGDLDAAAKGHRQETRGDGPLMPTLILQPDESDLGCRDTFIGDGPYVATNYGGFDYMYRRGPNARQRPAERCFGR